MQSQKSCVEYDQSDDEYVPRFVTSGIYDDVVCGSSQEGSCGWWGGQNDRLSGNMDDDAAAQNKIWGSFSSSMTSGNNGSKDNCNNDYQNCDNTHDADYNNNNDNVNYGYDEDGGYEQVDTGADEPAPVVRVKAWLPIYEDWEFITPQKQSGEKMAAAYDKYAAEQAALPKTKKRGTHSISGGAAHRAGECLDPPRHAHWTLAR